MSGAGLDVVNRNKIMDTRSEGGKEAPSEHALALYMNDMKVNIGTDESLKIQARHLSNEDSAYCPSY